MLLECEAAVRAQTFIHWEHLVLTDVEHEGCAAMCNRLAREAKGRWLFLIADDDLMLPDCLEKHLALTDDADIVYGPPEVDGEDPQQFRGSPPNIPSTALISTDLWRRLGGYDERLPAVEDRDFYERAMRRDIFARFRRVEDFTWIYRFHGNNKSRK
jgi:GT2 family glycosyltransferase